MENEAMNVIGTEVVEAAGGVNWKVFAGIGVGIVVIGGVIYIVRRKNKKNKAAKAQTSEEAKPVEESNESEE